MSTVCAALAMWATAGQAQQFELKGIRWGINEIAFRKAFANARCGETGDKKNLRPSERPSRLCRLSDFTVADQTTTDARFLFLNGQLASMGFFLYELSFQSLKDAVIFKYGLPTRTTDESLTWELKDARLFILKVGDRIAFDIDSPMAIATQERDRIQSLKRSAADL